MSRVSCSLDFSFVLLTRRQLRKKNWCIYLWRAPFRLIAPGLPTGIAGTPLYSLSRCRVTDARAPWRAWGRRRCWFGGTWGGIKNVKIGSGCPGTDDPTTSVHCYTTKCFTTFRNHGGMTRWRTASFDGEGEIMGNAIGCRSFLSELRPKAGRFPT